MTVLRRLLSKVGMIRIEVDTILEKDVINAGEEMRGIVKIKGTSMKQTIDGIHLTLSIKFDRNHNKRNIHTRFDLHREKIADKFTLQVNELKEIPFQFVVPSDTPVTFGDEIVWIHTNLDIKHAIDPVDIDYIHVQPNNKMKNVLEMIEEKGFCIDKVELSESPKQHKVRLPFVQEVLFKPKTINSNNKLSHLKLIPIDSEEYSVELVGNNKIIEKLIFSNSKELKNDIAKWIEELV